MKYTRALDYILAAVHFNQKGDFRRAAVALSTASAHKDINKVVAALNKHQQAALAATKVVAKAKPSLATALAELAAKKTAKKATKKTAKKKVKASEGDNFDDLVDSMTEAADADEMLTLDDLDPSVDGLSDTVEEMPVAAEGEDVDLDGEGLDDEDFLFDETVEAETDDESTEESDDAEEPAESDDEAEDDTAEEAAVAKAKVTRSFNNLQALARLSKPANK